MYRFSRLWMVAVASCTGLVAANTSFGQAATGPPVFAGIFGNRDLTVENPNDPGTNYTMVFHQMGSTDDIAYDPARGWGYEELYPNLDGPFPNPTKDGAQFGPFDDSPNQRNDYDNILPDLIYDSFIGFKDFSEECSEFTIGDLNTPCATVIPPEGGIFRIDVPNGSYRFVGVFGDADNVHAHRILAEDGGSGPPENIGPNHVVLVHNHDQAQYEIGETEPAELGEGVYALVAFDDKRPPQAQGSILPAFIPMDENGMPLVDADNVPTGAPPNSPVLQVTQGYLRLHLLQGNSNDGPGGPRDPNGGDLVLFEVYPVSGGVVTPLQPGDANMDYQFNQLDLVQVQVAAKYLTGQPATWGEGDWNGGPGGQQGSPPAGNGFFDQLDIIAALNAGKYLTGPYNAVTKNGTRGDDQTSIIYDPGTGEIAVDAPSATQLTSINIDSAARIFTGQAAQNLGGSFDNDADNNIFKATFGSSFGSLTFGNVAQPGLSEDFLANDLTVVGSLAGGGDLGAVDLIYVPEPATAVLIGLGLIGLIGLIGHHRRHETG